VNVAGRVALVTGAGHRVGRAIALTLAAAGARVAVHYNRSAVEADETVRLIEAAGGSAATFASDLARPEAPAALVADVVERFGALDVLVNSAAVMQRTPVGEVSVEAWDAMFALNLRAPFFAAQAAAAVMGDSGVIVTSPTSPPTRRGPPTCRTRSQGGRGADDARPRARPRARVRVNRRRAWRRPPARRLGSRGGRPARRHHAAPAARLAGRRRARRCATWSRPTT
jgi:hypothetical protein